ncbi:PREDICTED: NAC domain-containing protein 100-like [Nelumbo nucifera]|uniref:NAC domain-containing protein 100-like n=2 Tax=Nelumbo nucifera TaxID=4432 RepID=A0A1U8A4X6_NELNU|nr:PREDICTED: NAC domain-containing protein 100-like [Nelumbo nucifera]DAD27729.1 TPA_asm: hypothetical protein HUJ06_029197 [Nelumbo nucifera]
MDGVAKEESLPPGFRFHPTDEELITYYLTHKISDANFTGRAIADVDLNKCEPWDLPGKAKMGEKEWYFFSLRDRKYPTGVRTNRATNAGYWKTTGKDKEIFNSITSELVGMKKTLVFYKGRAPRGEKTNWVMHEYRLHSKTIFRTAKDEWVVCRVFQKSAAGGKKYLPNQTRSNPYNLEISQSGVAPIMQADTCHFPVGRNYLGNADLAELSRVLRGTPNGNIPIQSQLNYPGSCYTISGLNLNIGAPTQPAVWRTVTPVLNQQSITTDASSSLLTNCMLSSTDAGFSVDMNAAGNNRFQHMDPGVELENCWPPY